MKLNASLRNVIGGLGFFILAVYFLLIAYQLTVRRSSNFPDRLVAWRRRNAWSGLIYSLLLGLLGVWSLSRALSQMSRGGAARADDLILGLLFLSLAAIAAVLYKDLARRRADADERWWQSLQQHPRIFGIVFLIASMAAGAFGAAMLYNSIQQLF